MITARATPNIALIKYWGNRDDALRLPAADSLSMTLDSPHAEVTVERADAFAVRSQRPLTDAQRARFARHLELTRRYLAALGLDGVLPSFVSIAIRSEIPPGIGVASSSAVFSAVAEAYAGMVRDVRDLSRAEVSVIARLGSGSAARSVYGGYVALRANGQWTMDNGQIGSAFAEQIADEEHWLLHDIIVIPSDEPKKIGSTEGHALAKTSPYFPERLAAMPRRQKECIDAILTRDFEKLQRIAEEDCLDMHRVMQTSEPALNYLSDKTHRIVREIEELRAREHLPVLYTMDAGPTVHLFCTDEAREQVLAFARTQRGCRVLEARVGPGSRVV
jgi:diphosphomevalonate decarboxylase